MWVSQTAGGGSVIGVTDRHFCHTVWPEISQSEKLHYVEATGTSFRDNWTKANTALTVCSAVTLVGAIEVFLFGVIWTHGVYGSRTAWLAGVVLPLLAITAGLAWAGARYGAKGSPGTAGDGHHGTGPHSLYGRRDRRSAPRAVGVLSLVLLGIPFALAGLLLLTYGLIFVSPWFR